MNQFTHLTSDEFKSFVHLGKFKPFPSGQKAEYKDGWEINLPSSIDWVARGAVTGVKDQGGCGSCWAFATTGALEGAYFLKTGRLVSFSEQQLVSCDNTNQGCNGGWMASAYSWISRNGGISSEANYPYTGSQDSCSSGASVVPNSAPKSHVDVAGQNVNALMAAVAIGPVAVGVDADSDDFQFYSSGVLSSSACGNSLDHAVLVVGYGTANGQKFWKIKNSWSTSWGNVGYMLIARSQADICGVLDGPPNYPVL